MAEGKPEGLSDEEWAAVSAHRRDSAPKRRGTLRGTDPDSGAEYEIELTVEETAALAARHLKNLFGAGDGDGEGQGDGKKKPPAKPTPLKDYFTGGTRKAAGS